MPAITSLPRRAAAARTGFLVLAWTFFASILVQVLLAGLAIFDDPSVWAWHRRLATAIAVLPILMLLLAFAGRMETRSRWLAVVVFVLLNVQGATVKLGGAVGAFHTVNALLVFWASLALIRRGRAP